MNPLFAPSGKTRFALQAQDGRYASYDLGTHAPYLTSNPHLRYTFETYQQAFNQRPLYVNALQVFLMIKEVTV